MIEVTTTFPVVETNLGTITSWFPLTTSGLGDPRCSNGIYEMPPPARTLVAFNVWFGAIIDASYMCLPEEISSWWTHTHTPDLTSWGPFQCPSLYTTATTTVDAIGTFIGCCPSAYTFDRVIAMGALGQCYSTYTSGQTLQVWTTSDLWIESTSTVTEDIRSVWAVHVNGYMRGAAKAIATFTETPQTRSTTLSGNFAGLKTSSSATSITTTSVVLADASFPFPGDATRTGAAPLADSSSSLSGGAIAGIAVGAAIVVLGTGILLGFPLFFRRANARTENEMEAIERELGHGRVPSYTPRGELERLGAWT